MMDSHFDEFTHTLALIKCTNIQYMHTYLQYVYMYVCLLVCACVLRMNLCIFVNILVRAY